MAFHIKQENYNLVPTAEQNKVFREAFRMTDVDISRARIACEGDESAGAPLTRIGAHFLIRWLLGRGTEARTAEQLQRANIRRRQLKEWRDARVVKREARKAALAAIGQ
jgi:hypothetical protein